MALIFGGGGSGGAGGILEDVRNIAFVSAAGDNGTAVIGTPSLSFTTAQAAYDAIVAAGAGSYVILLGIGSFGGITVTGNLSTKLKAILGVGRNVSLLGGLSSVGAEGDAAPSEDDPGEAGANGGVIDIVSDGCVDFGNVDTSGGNGGAGGINNQNGGAGGQAGSLRLIQVYTSGAVSANGGTGGEPGGGGTGGDGGTTGSLFLIDCYITGQVNCNGGSAGTGGVAGANGGSFAFVNSTLINGYSITEPVVVDSHLANTTVWATSPAMTNQGGVGDLGSSPFPTFS